MSKIKLVIFDLDNTLVITKPAAKEGYKQAIYYLAKLHGLEKQKDKLYNHWKRMVSHLVGESKPHMRRFEHSLLALLEAHQIPDTYLSQAVNLYQKEMLKRLEPQNGAKELLSWLKDNQISRGVATGSERAEAVKKLKAAGLYHYISVLITPNETKVMPPHPKFFEYILKETKNTPSQTLVVGDNQKEDLDPAVKLGMATSLLPPSQTNLVAIKSIITETLWQNPKAS